MPRDGATTDQREQFEGNKWEQVKIHFGKQKGMKLGEIPAQSLNWWIHDWQPKPFNGKIDPDNLVLRAALDAAGLESDGR